MSIITSPSEPGHHDHRRVSSSSSSNNNNNKSRFHRRNQSEELDIFEATKYFSGDSYYHDIVSNRSFKASITFPDHEKIILKENSGVYEERKFHGQDNIIPPDAAIRSNVVVLPHNRDPHVEKQMINIKEVKKVKQPSSPGGKLASLLTSLFLSHSPSHHFHSKKKSKSSSTKNSIIKDADHYHQIIRPCEIRRKRRNSISHFQGSTTTAAAASTIDCSNNNCHVLDERKVIKVEKKKKKKNLSNGYAEKDRIWAYKYPSEERELMFFRKNNLKEVNHKADHVDQREVDSDSSSDLFELQIINDSTSSSTRDLPVYETTNYMESIKIGISSDQSTMMMVRRKAI